MKYPVPVWPPADRAAYYDALKLTIEAGVKAGDLVWDDATGRSVGGLTPEGREWIDAIKATGYESPFTSALRDWQSLAAWESTASKAMAMGATPAAAFERADEQLPEAAALMAATRH